VFLNCYCIRCSEAGPWWWRLGLQQW